MLREIDDFFLHQEEPAKSCLIALRDIILSSDENVTAAWKYRMPMFCYRGKMFCYLWKDKNTDEPYLGIVEGKHIDHPKLEWGKRSRMKIFRINPDEDLDVKTIQSLLQEMLDLYRRGIVKI